MWLLPVLQLADMRTLILSVDKIRTRTFFLTRSDIIWKMKECSYRESGQDL
jgi:hypothetical protein